MARWWDTEMVDASQQGFSDPNLALQIASSPAELYTGKQQKEDEKQAREEKSGFLGSILNVAGKVDGALSNIPGWGVTKDVAGAVWAPVDKLASGMHWLYSEGVSQPLSTGIIQAAKAQTSGDLGVLFSGEEWSEAYGEAETLSPGQAGANAALTQLAVGQTPFVGMGNIQNEQQKQQLDRFLYDTDYWRDKLGWKYTSGTGASDFAFLMGADPSTYILGAAGAAVKGVRSVQIASKGGELVREQGKVVAGARKLAGKPARQSLEDVSKGKKMNDFFDWIHTPGANGAATKTAEEIAAHPIWGKGRRANNFKHQYSDVLARTPREEMPAMYRYFAGDNAAVAELASSGSQTLNNIGKLSENRVLVDSAKFDPTLLAYFAEKAGATSKAPAALAGPSLALSPEYVKLHEEAAQAVVSGSKRMKINQSGEVSKRFVKGAEEWKNAQLSLINDEMAALSTKGQYLRDVLGGNMGKTADEFSPTASDLFGNMQRAYRAGAGAFRDTGLAAEKKFANQMKDRKGRFVSDGIRAGFTGTPLRIIQAFGDNAPVGRINHNEADAGDRVLDMLKQVPALGQEQRMTLFNQYMQAGDKVGKSRALDGIHQSIINHLAGRVNGLDPEVANIIGEMSRVGIAKTMDDLMGVGGKSSIQRPQAFSAATDETGQRVDALSRYTEDGVSYGFAPLARTQLSQTDALLPIKDIERVISRNAGAIKAVRAAGGSALDATRVATDNLNTLWKASTLLRPAYMPRMISEEAALSAIKFGFMSRLVADPAKGAKNFVLNRAQQVWAEVGRGSYAPSTGAGLDSSLAVVKIGDEEILQSVAARRSALQQELSEYQALPTNPERLNEIQTALKGKVTKGERKALKAELGTIQNPAVTARLEGELKMVGAKRIRVNKALPVVRARIEMEKELHTGLASDLKRFESRLAKAKTPGKQQQLQAKIDDIVDRMDDHQTVMDEFTDYANEILRQAAGSVGRRAGEGKFSAFGYEVPQAFSKAWENSIPREQITSDKAYAAMYARGEAVDVGRMMKTGGWTTIQPDEPQHMTEWLHALNRQFGQDDVFLKVAEDGTGKSAREWLRTPDGQQHLEDLGIRGRDINKFVDDVVITMDKYLPEDTGLRQKMVDGEEITSADLAKAIAEGDRPVVHGQEIKSMLGLWSKDTGANMLDRMIEKGFKRLGSIPSDVMSRQPVYLKFQEIQYKRLLQQELSYRASVGKANDALTPQELEKILHESDKLARKDISQVVYDPKRTSASEAMRFLSPFFSAHADGLARWGGMIAEQPEMLGKVARIYNAPVAANMVTDQNGNLVGKDGYADVRDPVTGKIVDRVFVPITERTLQLKMPWAPKGSGTTPIKLSAMNTILPGDPWFNPGSGPLVQVAGTEIAKASPRAGDFLQWAKILPYGPSGSVTEAVTPKYMRAIWDAWQGADPDNEAYQKAYLSVYNMKVAQYYESDGKDTFTKKEIEEEAKAFLNMEVLEAWASPAQTQQTPLTGTPYQFFVDQYSQMRAIDPENARDKFLAKFGTDYMSFTAGLTKSMGIAATISADEMAEKYSTEIADDPDMAQFWVGDVYNGGPFSSSVYQKQKGQSFGSAKARENITADEAITKSQEQQGWTEYTKAKGQLDAALIRAGFKSYAQKGAEGFLAAKQQVTTALSERYPAWDQSFNEMDMNKVPNRIKSFEKAITDERLMTDPMRQEMQPLAQYILARQQFKKILEARGSKQLSFGVDGSPSGKNADVGMAWDQVVTGLINSNTAFAELYNRYLTNDRLQ
ncbi:MAG TPA: hypothetical protein VIY48_08225 [Candidatus Paceibacterota bacterium]